MVVSAEPLGHNFWDLVIPEVAAVPPQPPGSPNVSLKLFSVSMLLPHVSLLLFGSGVWLEIKPRTLYMKGKCSVD